MDSEFVRIGRKEAEAALANSKKLNQKNNDWMCEVIELAMLPQVQEWMRRTTRMGMILERAGGTEDPSRSRFPTLEEWRAHFYLFPGYVLKSTKLEGYVYNGVPIDPEDSERRGYSHSATHVIEGLRRDEPEIYWPLVRLVTFLNGNGTREDSRPLIVVEEL